jgi:carbamoyl-phosphate synthase small subunit
MWHMCIGMQGGTMKALIALEDGRVFEGRNFGAEGEKEGEIVFNTSMTGYQEIMTDPSYKGQIVTMTYPLIGNYGVNDEDVESKGPKVEGFIAREFSRVTSNYRATGDLLSYFTKHNILAIEEIDTRALTKHLRVRGAMKGIISTRDLDPESLVRKARQWKGIVGVDLVKEVTCSEAYEYDENVMPQVAGRRSQAAEARSSESGTLCPEPCALRLHVVVMDFGVKMNILRMLKKAGCDVTVVPAWEKAETILAMKPDGVLLSNGPGDPEGVPYAITEIRKLFGKVPIFGICLGQQLLGLAYGGKTYKLKFGHRGANQPIQEIATGKVSITSENHGFAVDVDSIKEHPVRITHINLNDKTIEGIEHTELPIFSVQYHPEASPGPHDSYGLFEKFKNMMNANREKK